MADEQEIQGLVAGLRDFRSRSRAIQGLVALGADAVAPLTEALHSESSEGARWAILRCLGELRAEQSVGHIAPLLDDRRFRDAAHNALVRIVGEDLGPAAQAWLTWAQQERSGGGAATVLDPEMHMTGLPDDRLMQVALKGCNVFWSAEAPGRYGLRSPLEDGESQEVTANLALKDHEGSPIVIVYADCGPASAEHFEYALRRNLRMPYGALAVRDSPSGPQFVMFNTLLREDLSPLELRKSVLAVAERAARVRREIESGDTEDSAG